MGPGEDYYLLRKIIIKAPQNLHAEKVFVLVCEYYQTSSNAGKLAQHGAMEKGCFLELGTVGWSQATSLVDFSSETS